MDKEIPGFRMQVVEIVEEYKLGSIEALCKVKDIRTVMRKVIIEEQKQQLLDSMILKAKTDNILCNFNFTGSMLHYLLKLPFPNAKYVFLLRSRMFPTKENIKG